MCSKRCLIIALQPIVHVPCVSGAPEGALDDEKAEEALEPLIESGSVFAAALLRRCIFMALPRE